MCFAFTPLPGFVAVSNVSVWWLVFIADRWWSASSCYGPLEHPQRQGSPVFPASRCPRQRRTRRAPASVALSQDRSGPAAGRLRMASAQPAVASLAVSIPVVGLAARKEGRPVRGQRVCTFARSGPGLHRGLRRPSRARLGRAVAAAAGPDSDPVQAPDAPGRWVQGAAEDPGLRPPIRRPGL